jgi:phenylalanyl-tRNA synthetase beta chain
LFFFDKIARGQIFKVLTMKFTFDWLKDHIETDLSYEEIAEKLTNLGIEVEEVIDNKRKFENFVVGFINNTKRHPNADKLKVCMVNIGKEELQIVCGASNARPGIFVAVALVGALIPAFNEKLKKSVIRGVESRGMMCSANELLVSEKTDGILELPNFLIPGQSLSSAFEMDEIVFDVSLTSNRSDCFSVRGIARELSAIGAGKLVPFEECVLSESFENPIDVEIESENCKYFSTLAIKDIEGKTPDYIAKRLSVIGQNLIHMPVDIANYVCIDIGQPLHIFDIDKLSPKLIIKDSQPGELIETLDNKNITLPGEVVVVSDENGPLSIAGIMGGKKSAFSENSKSILIEGAYFNKISIAKAGQQLKLTTDSRTRFERGVDPEMVSFAVKYTAFLISKCCNCKISNMKKQGKLPTNENIIEVSFPKFHILTGLVDSDFLSAKLILEKLGMIIESANSEKIVVKTPSWRYDLLIEEDIIDEIIKTLGYEDIQEMELSKLDPITQIYTIDKISDALIYNGYYEVKTFSFIDHNTAALFSNELGLISIEDALTTEFSTLRPSVIASHLKCIKNSQNKSQKNSRIFEIGKRFYQMDEKIVEENMAVALLSGRMDSRNWRKEQAKVSIFDIKEDLERVLNMIGVGTRLEHKSPSYYHPGRSGTYVFQKDTPIAHFGEIHPSILFKIGILGPIVCFELFLDKLPEFFEYKVKSPPFLSPYQMATRDFSFIVKKSVAVSEILNAVKKQKIAEVKNISIFDVYESKTIGEDEKAVAFEVLLQSDKSTLSDEQINNISLRIVEAISEDCSGVLRDK